MRHLKHLMALLALLGMGACSSTFGGGSDPPPSKVLVVPSGQAVACPDGTVPPCH